VLDLGYMVLDWLVSGGLIDGLVDWLAGRPMMYDY